MGNTMEHTTVCTSCIQSPARKLLIHLEPCKEGKQIVAEIRPMVSSAIVYHAYAYFLHFGKSQGK